MCTGICIWLWIGTCSPHEVQRDVHEALSLMFQHKGVPLSMVMDGFKEQTLGKLCQNLVDAHGQLKQTELYSPLEECC